MATTITWKIPQLERETLDGFVFRAEWEIIGVGDLIDPDFPEKGNYDSGKYGECFFERPENLVPYEDITEELAISWVKQYLGPQKVTELENEIVAQIINDQSPSTAEGTPWS